MTGTQPPPQDPGGPPPAQEWADFTAWLTAPGGDVEARWWDFREHRPVDRLASLRVRGLFAGW